MHDVDPHGAGRRPASRRWSFDTVDRLDRVPYPARAKLAGMTGDLETFERLLVSLPGLGRIEARLPPGGKDEQRPNARAAPAASLRVGFLRLGPGADTAAVARLAERAGVGVLMLARVDVGMQRSANLHAAAAIAGKLAAGYAFAIEALALPSGPAGTGPGGRQDLWGLSGAAVLFRRPLSRMGLLRVDMSGRWFVDAPLKLERLPDGGTAAPGADGPVPEGPASAAKPRRRLGGTAALFAQTVRGSPPVTLVTATLDETLGLGERRRQLLDALKELDGYDPLAPTLIGLDPGCPRLLAGLHRFNGRPRLVRLARTLVRGDPLLDALLSRGFSWVSGPPEGAGGASCGVFFARGLACRRASVIPAIVGERRAAAGDLVVVDVEAR